MSIKPILKSLLALTTVFALASCADNDVYNPENGQSTSDLKVPANFDWSTTRTVTCSITSPVNTQVSIYSDKECKDNQLLAEVFVSKEKATTTTLELLTLSNTFYIQYPTVDNNKKVLEVTSQATTKAESSVVLPEDAKSSDFDEATGTTLTYRPAKDLYGTVMFEDLYPEKGDYDFNDFVINYNTCVAVTIGAEDNFTDYAIIKLQIRAIGGNKPYRPGFELTSVTTKTAREGCTIESDTEGIGLELISKADNDPAVFVITGTGQLKDGAFYNTEKISDKNMPTITCTIKRDNLNSTGGATQFSHLAFYPNYTNFFLQNTQTLEEIHLKGYPTTKLATNQGAIFHSDDNFVWGMKIPAMIPYPKEKEDITNAFKYFKDWVTSGGNTWDNWYKHYDSDKVLNP